MSSGFVSAVILSNSWTRRVAIILACCVITVPIRSDQSLSKQNIGSLPRYVLWAWERPEDLRFIDPGSTAVAFLSQTIAIRGENFVVRPRFQPLRVPDSAKLIAVTRIEADPTAALGPHQIEQSAATIARTAFLPRVVAIQVDFDATLTQRGFYRALLVELRQRFGPKALISITALASWCLDDDWISTLPVDEAVPMLFRMGAGTNDVVARLNSGRDFHSQLCRDSLGVSTDERWDRLASGRRVYVFNPSPWTKKAESAFLQEVEQWR
jgi:hypothetical protein